MSDYEVLTLLIAFGSLLVGLFGVILTAVALTKKK
ncbi:putative holin-like toxin [Neobacillus drentensis]